MCDINNINFLMYVCISSFSHKLDSGFLLNNVIQFSNMLCSAEVVIISFVNVSKYHGIATIHLH